MVTRITISEANEARFTLALGRVGTVLEENQIDVKASITKAAKEGGINIAAFEFDSGYPAALDAAEAALRTIESGVEVTITAT